jgi:hypothetical protein
MSYCTKGQTATLFYRFNGQLTNSQVSISDSPFDVQVGDSNNGGTCFKFSGQGKFNDYYYNFFACGISASWFDTGVFLRPQINGGFPFDSIYGVRYGSQSIITVEKDTPDKNYQVLGNCFNCQGSSCKISIVSNGVKIWSAIGNCPVKYSVACGIGCPDGYIKCLKQEYPGYCCVDCASTKSRIDTLTNTVKRLSNG